MTVDCVRGKRRARTTPEVDRSATGGATCRWIPIGPRARPVILEVLPTAIAVNRPDAVAVGVVVVLRDVAAEVGITERAVQKIVRDLQDAGFLTVTKQGRCNRYRINKRRSLRHGSRS